MDLKQVNIHCGPTRLAYRLSADGLEVWIGELVNHAPLDAQVVEITPGHETWVIGEVEALQEQWEAESFQEIAETLCT